VKWDENCIHFAKASELPIVMAGNIMKNSMSVPTNNLSFAFDFQIKLGVFIIALLGFRLQNSIDSKTVSAIFTGYILLNNSSFR
jgi:hypothetical protein